MNAPQPMKWVCVHHHMGSAVSAAMAMPGAVEASPEVAWVPADVLPPGSVLARNGSGGWRPDDGSVYGFDSRGIGATAHRREKCLNPLCRMAQ
mgnify:CR=1 FL=1